MLENMPISNKYEFQAVAPTFLTALLLYVVVIEGGSYHLITSFMNMLVLTAGVSSFAITFYHTRNGNFMWQRKNWKFRNTFLQIIFGLLFTILFLIIIIFLILSSIVLWIKPYPYNSSATQGLTALLGMTFIFGSISAKYFGNVLRRV